MEDIFSASGKLARYHPQYEPRDGQLVMAKAVADALQSKHVLVAQAGTGLGKTFAYLVPAIMFALRENKRVVISTRTISLQEQVFKKDIPFLQRALAPEYVFVAVLAKGRGNFLCRRKMDSLRSYDRGILTEKAHVDELREIQRMVLTKSLKVGDREETGTRIATELWPLVSGDGDACIRRQCPYVDSCYYYVARRAQAKANVIVVNHALFFADTAIRKEADFTAEKAVLEDYAAVVFDEAHNLEDVATDFFSYRVSQPRVRLATTAVLGSFRPLGVLNSVAHGGILATIESAAQRLMSEAGLFFAALGEPRRLNTKDPIENTMKKPLQNLAETIVELKGGDNSDEQDAHIAMLVERMGRIDRDLEFILSQQEGDKFAYWVEAGSSDQALVAAPVSLVEDLREHLIRRVDTVILTSATLSSRLVKRLGVETCQLLNINSPFDYARRALLYLPKNAMEPSESPLYDAYAAQQIEEIVAVTEGRALVLFTSYRAMHNVYERLSTLKEKGYVLLKQGDDSHGVTLQKFRTGHMTVLLAVASYWEGIDVPGAALSCVVVVRLPFSVPTEPIVQARCEALERLGGSSFYDYSLPQAVLRLKQGFGRLIRTVDDKGVVAILDDRLQKKSYGKAFLRELPPARVTHDLDDVRQLLS
ncbi:MAG: ATP-dependent DNA helicase [Peptococcaceae bacterium]|nr:ATP-dependent DNA helicase [Peptococcaceae bacterium]